MINTEKSDHTKSKVQNPEKKVCVRHALPDDVKDIKKLLDFYSARGVILSRSKKAILNNINTFAVCEHFKHISACCALRDFGNNLYEIRSLAVIEENQNQKLGSELLKFHLNELKKNNSSSGIFALTYSPGFFAKFDFQIVEKSIFPEKIWADCSNCPKKNKCDEIAVYLELKNEEK